MDMQFTWIGYYTELADKLLPYRNNRQALIAKLQETYARIGMKFPKLGSEAVPADIDPFTVFGLFNKGITDANRKKVIAPPSRRRLVWSQSSLGASRACPC